MKGQKEDELIFNFRSTSGFQNNISINENATIEELIIKFLKEINQEKLIGETKGIIQFMVGTNILDPESKDTVKKLVSKVNGNMKIVIMDTSSVLGNWQFVFKERTRSVNILISAISSIKELINKYKETIGNSNESLEFLYKSKKINPNDSTKIIKYFDENDRGIKEITVTTLWKFIFKEVTRSFEVSISGFSSIKELIDKFLIDTNRKDMIINAKDSNVFMCNGNPLNPNDQNKIINTFNVKGVKEINVISYKGIK